MFNLTYKWIKRLFFLVWGLAMIIVGMWIFYENQVEVTVNYLGIEVAGQPLGLVICQMLVAGAVLGYLSCLVTFKSRAVWYKHRLHRAKKDIEKLKSADSQTEENLPAPSPTPQP